jgi:hypothetical protein
MRHDELDIRYGLTWIHHATDDLVAETLQAIRRIQPIYYTHLQPFNRRPTTINRILYILPLAPNQQNRTTDRRMFPPGLVPADWVSNVTTQQTYDTCIDCAPPYVEMSQAASSFSQLQYTPGWVWSKGTKCHTCGLWYQSS